MILTLNLKPFDPKTQNTQNTRKPSSIHQSQTISFISNSHKNSKIAVGNNYNSIKARPKYLKPFLNPPPGQITPTHQSLLPKKHFSHVGDDQILRLCGLGYWVQGFRCFPWLALNFFLKDSLNLQPSTLQLVQNSANLPMVAKPLYGILSDAIYIGDAHRIPYISIGVFLQILSWGTLALIPLSGSSLPAQMACILLGNLGAAITEVASDALLAELGKKRRGGDLQSYAFMALATGGVFGNLFGGIILMKTQEPTTMFLIFCLLLCLQLMISSTTREKSFDPSRTTPSFQKLKPHFQKSKISKSISKPFSDLISVINEEKIFQPLVWAVASIAVVPILSGTTFCYQTQFLKIDPSTIGLSKVIGQLILLSTTVFYNRFLKRIPTRKLVCVLQIIYAITILSDWFLVKQFNLLFGISNQAYVLCLSALAETVAQFKILPFTILLAKLCPPGCEGSLLAFFTSALCLSSIFSGFMGVGLVSLIGVSSDDYSSLPIGIFLQFMAALTPLAWISRIPLPEYVGKGKIVGKNTKVR